jgi:hypothetical protein
MAGEKWCFRQQSSQAPMSPRRKPMKKLIECIVCHFKWWGKQGDCEICEQCMQTSIPDSIGG